MRKVKVEVEIVTYCPGMGDEDYFVCNVYRGVKKVYSAVSAHRSNVKDKALRGYEARIKACEFEVRELPERFVDAKAKPKPEELKLTSAEVLRQAKSLIKTRLFPDPALLRHLDDIKSVLDQ